MHLLISVICLSAINNAYMESMLSYTSNYKSQRRIEPQSIKNKNNKKEVFQCVHFNDVGKVPDSSNVFIRFRYNLLPLK